MADLRLKLLLLRSFLWSAFTDWKTQIWQQDLDGLYCCNGRECGCYGSTLREVYTWQETGKTTAHKVIQDEKTK